jgi:hypothetical protein
MDEESGSSLNVNLNSVIKRNIPTIQGAVNALVAMREEMIKCGTYAEIQKFIREAKAIQLLYEHVAEV